LPENQSSNPRHYVSVTGRRFRAGALVISWVLALALGLGGEISHLSNSNPAYFNLGLANLKRDLSEMGSPKNIIVEISAASKYRRYSAFYIFDMVFAKTELRFNIACNRGISVQSYRDIFVSLRFSVPLPICPLNSSGLLKGSIKGRGMAIVYDRKRNLYFLTVGKIKASAINFKFNISPQLAPRSLTSFPKSPNQKSRSQTTHQKSPKRILGSFRSRIRSLPLGAKVGIAFVFPSWQPPSFSVGFAT
jgi:hypothetical protein